MLSIFTRILCLLLLVLSNISQLYAAECPTIEPLMELREGLTAPTRIAVDTAGNFYITDPRQKAVLKFDSTGTFIERFESAPVFGSGLAISPDGRKLFIAARNAVNIVDTTSDQVIGRLGAADEFDLTGSLALDGEGRVFVSDRGERLIKVYQLQYDEPNIQGQMQYSFGQGRFTSIFAMAVDSGSQSVYVADGILTDNSQRRVEVFTLSGFWQRTLFFDSAFGAKKLGFAGAIGFDDAQRIYVADQQNGNLRVLASDGQFLGSLLLSGHSVGTLWQPRGLAYLSGEQPGTGRLLVANSDGRISMFALATPVPFSQQLEEKVALLRELDNGTYTALINRIEDALTRDKLSRLAKLTSRLTKEAEGELATAAAELVALLQ